MKGAFLYPNKRGMLLVETAFTWLYEGVATVPCLPQSKECHLHWRAWEKKLPTGDHLRRWFSPGNVNIALVCGSPPGQVCVLDFDRLESWQAWQDRAGLLARTYTEMTGRGIHAFYKTDNPVNRHFELCEVLGLGHLCLVYPSIHPSGKPYQVASPIIAPILQVESDRLFSLLSKGQSQQLGQIEANTPAHQARPINEDKGLITRLRTGYPLLSLASQLTTLARSRADGRYMLGKCPFHEDDHPSFWIDTELQLWGCYTTSCKGSKGGDVINLYAIAHGLTVREAIRQMAMRLLCKP